MEELLSKTLNEFDYKKMAKTAGLTAAAGALATVPLLTKSDAPSRSSSPTAIVSEPDAALGLEDVPVGEKTTINLDHIIQIESSGNEKAVNRRSGARGLTQITKPTWEEMVRKMGVNWSWDDAFDGEKNRVVGEYYINTEIPRLLEYYGIEDTVKHRLMAYNWGIGNVKKWYRSKGKASMPSETSNYIEKYEKLKGVVEKISERELKHYWITKNGELEVVEQGHDKWSKPKIAKKYKGIEFEDSPSYVWQRDMGDIRLTEYGDSVGFVIVGNITPVQLGVMRRISQGKDSVGWTLLTKTFDELEASSCHGPESFREMAKDIRKYNLVGEVDESLDTSFFYRHYWIYPRGQLEEIPGRGTHCSYAGTYYKLKRGSEAAAYRYMEEKKAIRVYLLSNEGKRYVAFETISKPTLSQMSTIRKIAKGAEEVTFEISVKTVGGKYVSGSSYNKLSQFYNHDYSREVDESIIDYPRETLSPDIWVPVDSGYVLDSKAKNIIIATLKKYPEFDLATIGVEYHITGSICTNQYTEDTDVDVHIVMDEKSPHANEDVQKNVFRWFNEYRDEIGGYIAEHPIEVYLQMNPAQEYLSDGVYDILNDKWLKGPGIVPMDFDPYDEYGHLIDIVREEAKRADIELGELRRDVRDYVELRDYIARMPLSNKKKLLLRLHDKLNEIESDIETLYDIRGEWTKARNLASQPKTVEQALEDAELAKTWRDKNAVFKFLGRYHYLKVLGDLYDMIEDEELTDEEISRIGTLVGM